MFENRTIHNFNNTGEETPAPTKPPLPVAGSLDFPDDDNEPLSETGKSWVSVGGVDQKIDDLSPVEKPRSPNGSSSSEEAADQQQVNLSWKLIFNNFGIFSYFYKLQCVSDY